MKDKWNRKLNAVSRLAYGIAGGSKRFYSLTKADRFSIRQAARRLHSQDVEFTSAASQVDSSPDGFVYIITHPAFPGYVKIGMAVDVESRLSSFQTGCPRRAYRCNFAIYTANRRETEAAIHKHLAHRRAEGEWFLISKTEARAVLEAFASGESND